MRGRGGISGPDLTSVGAELTLAEIEQALLKPEARRTKGYQVVSVDLRSGESIRGFLRNETNYDLQIQSLDGRIHSLRTADVANVRRESESLMPRTNASADELQNLLAFLTHPSSTTGPAVSDIGLLPGAITWENLVRPKPGDWPTYHGQLGGNRRLGQLCRRIVRILLQHRQCLCRNAAPGSVGFQPHQL